MNDAIGEQDVGLDDPRSSIGGTVVDKLTGGVDTEGKRLPRSCDEVLVGKQRGVYSCAVKDLRSQDETN